MCIPGGLSPILTAPGTSQRLSVLSWLPGPSWIQWSGVAVLGTELGWRRGWEQSLGLLRSVGLHGPRGPGAAARPRLL